MWGPKGRVPLSSAYPASPPEIARLTTAGKEWRLPPSLCDPATRYTLYREDAGEECGDGLLGSWRMSLLATVPLAHPPCPRRRAASSSEESNSIPTRSRIAALLSLCGLFSPACLPLAPIPVLRRGFR
jgi:hypothetical protein